MPQTHPSYQATETLRIALLGGFRVEVGARQIAESAWRLRKARTLMKLLALAPGHQLHREQLWDHLWPEMEPEAAANNLHRTLHAARHALQPLHGAVPASVPWLTLHGDLVRLAPRELLWIDVEAFEAAAQETHARDDPAAVRAALDLYTGELLPEDRYEDWAAPRREALRLLWVDLLRALAAAHEARGEYDRAAETWQRVLAGEPAHEEAHRALMRLYAQMGQRQRALHQYDALRQALARELGLEPDAESERLHQQIRDGRFPLAMEPPDVMSAAAREAAHLDRRDTTAAPVPAADAGNRRVPSASSVPSGGLGSVPAPLSGTVTFFFSDLAGSTRLLQRLDAARYSAALDRQRELVRAAFAAHQGHEMDTQGDSFFAVFPTAEGAVAAALAIQRDLAAETWPEGAEVRVRIGLHTGVPLVAGDHYVGLDVVLAARIMAVGHGGQILLSAATSALVERRLPDGATLCDLGEHRLKDFDRPEHLYQFDAADLPSAFAPLKTLGTPGAPRHNLPTQLTSFIGREREVAELTRLLTMTRLLTLAGPGGAGKTRLSLAVAGELLDDYPDGVWAVELAGLGDPSLVPQAVASALGVPEQSGRSLTETLSAFLETKRVLLLLDNCEHLITAAARVAEALLRDCPALRILATSREPLHIGGELLWRVPSLNLPDPREMSGAVPDAVPDLAALGRYESVRLFVERACAIKPSFRLDERTAGHVARLCHRLDGMPLALELAAARVGMMTVEQIVARLDDSIALLTGGTRTALTRQQTLRAALDWSHALLDGQERAALRRLAVFAGGFTLEAAEAVVADGEQVETSAVLDLLGRLVDKSLVVAEAQGDAEEARYRLLEPIRQYAHAQLRDAGELAAAHRRHLDWHVELAERAVERLWGTDHVTWLQRLETEHHNLRAALGWAQRDDSESGLRLAGALGQFWLVRGYLVEGWQWLQSLLGSTPETSSWRARALFSAWSLAVRRYDHADALLLVEQNVVVQRQLGNQRETACALHHLGLQAWQGGEVQRGYALLEESRTHARDLGLVLEYGLATHTLGVISASDGRYDEGRALLEESLAQFRAARHQPDLLFPLVFLSWTPILQDDGGQAQIWLWEQAMMMPRTLNSQSATGFALANLGALARLEADHSRARAMLEESLELFRQIGDQAGAAHALSQLGNLARVVGNFDQAHMFLGESLALHRALDDRLGIGLALCNLANLAAVEGDYERARALSEEGHGIFRETENREAMIWATHSKVFLAARQRDYDQATRLLHEELALWHQWRASSERCGLATGLVNLGIVARMQGDGARARTQFEASLPPLSEMGADRCFAVVFNELGNLSMAESDYLAASGAFMKSLHHAHEAGDDRGTAIALERLACVAAASGDAREAARLAGAVSRIREAIGGQVSAECQTEIDDYLQSARRMLAAEEFAAAWAEGRTLAIDAAIATALAMVSKLDGSVTDVSSTEKL